MGTICWCLDPGLCLLLTDRFTTRWPILLCLSNHAKVSTAPSAAYKKLSAACTGQRRLTTQIPNARYMLYCPRAHHSMRSQLKLPQPLGFLWLSIRSCCSCCLFVTILVFRVLAVNSTFCCLLFLPDPAQIMLLKVGERRQPESSLTKQTLQRSLASQMTLCVSLYSQPV